MFLMKENVKINALMENSNILNLVHAIIVMINVMNVKMIKNVTNVKEIKLFIKMNVLQFALMDFMKIKIINAHLVIHLAWHVKVLIMMNV